MKNTLCFWMDKEREKERREMPVSPSLRHDSGTSSRERPIFGNGPQMESGRQGLSSRRLIRSTIACLTGWRWSRLCMWSTTKIRSTITAEGAGSWGWNWILGCGPPRKFLLYRAWSGFQCQGRVSPEESLQDVSYRPH